MRHIRFIGLKDLRQNLSKITRRALKKNEHLIVMRKNVPIFTMDPITKKQDLSQRLLKDIAEAEADVAAGRVLTQAQVEKELGL